MDQLLVEDIHTQATYVLCNLQHERKEFVL